MELRADPQELPGASVSGNADWHALPAEEVMARQDSRSGGLSEAEAARRLALHGPNSLRVAQPLSAWKILLAQVKSLVVALLAGAALVSFLAGELLEAVAILAVLVLNTAVGFWTEWSARRAVDGLRKLQVQEAVVRRGDRLQTIDAALLVPGDVIVLEAGAAVPADGRLLIAHELKVTEAPLTGESLPVVKTIEPVTGGEAGAVPVADRLSMVYKGTLVATGSGEAVVTGTGAGTEIGRISELIEEAPDEPTPLERRLDRLGRRLVGAVLAIAAVVTVIGVLRGGELWRMLETGVALAVAAVPEGLPIVATITLAVGMRRMVKRRALLRHLPSVETLGSTTVICTDKTGTLTAGEMTVTRLFVAGTAYKVSGGGYDEEGEITDAGGRVDVETRPGLELALRIGTLVNRARLRRVEGDTRVEGDPTEAALLVLARKAAVDREKLGELYPEIAEVPFSSERMLMATFHRTPAGELAAYVKGAPGKIVALCDRAVSGDGAEELSDEGRERLLEVNRELAGRGLRMLALATRAYPAGTEVGEGELTGLDFVGFVGISDPPAAGVRETVDELAGAGIRTVMITGDQVITAAAVGEELGVLRAGERTIDGRSMFGMSDSELAAEIADVSVFARISPEDKLRIVRAFQQRGDIVGMLGDGVNDAPALKQADIGVAMGLRGTDVAKETAEMVLSDDRFATVAAAVEEGRVVFDNIRKFIFYLFSCNLAEALVVFVSVAAGLPLPLLPLQILWLNLVTDVFPALALAVEPAEPDVMRRPPRDPEAAILSRRFMGRTGVYSVLIAVTTFAAFGWALTRADADLGHAVTMSFMTLAFAQLLHVFNARSDEAVLFGRRLWSNRWVWLALALTTGLQLLAVYLPPLSRVLRTSQLSPVDWGVVVLASSAPLLGGQIYRAVSVHRHRKAGVSGE